MGIEAFAFYVASRFTGTSSARSTVISAGGTAPNTGLTLLPPGDTGVATTELTKELSLPSTHVRGANKLMRSHGREILGVDEDTPVTAALIRAAITDVTPLGANALRLTLRRPLGEWTSIPSTPSSRPPMDRRHPKLPRPRELTRRLSPLPAPHPSSTALTSTQIDQAINAIQKNYGVKLNTKQTAAVRSALSARTSSWSPRAAEHPSSVRANKATAM